MSGIKTAFAMRKIGLGMLKTRRLNPLEFFISGGIKEKNQLQQMLNKPLQRLKIAGYVGCQTNRPFGIDGESFENPKYLDKMVDIMSAEAADKYEQKVTCCGGALQSIDGSILWQFRQRIRTERADYLLQKTRKDC